MIAFLVDIEFLWGFQARIAGLSKTSPSFYYPPPSTILGALSEAIARKNYLGEREGKKLIPLLSQDLLAIGFRAKNYIPLKYEDLNKIITVRKVGAKDVKTKKNIQIMAPHPLYLDKSFDSPARGKTILSTLDCNPPIIRFFIVFREGRVVFNDKDIKIDEDCFWRIHRLGSKESRISTINVIKISSPEMLTGRVSTTFSFPLLDGLVPLFEKTGSWEQEWYINPFEIGAYDEKENPITNYMLGEKIVPFKVPILRGVLNIPEYVLEFKGDLAAYKYDGEVVIGRW
ncbi:MAG: type I-A CRISPR-associated protein Cas5 [Candidatus Methanomethylicota archaeon]|nr:MAG: type I-A CRISPR-associated protein Cas5 [Candidatus Verstraetearchaeota archaeon]